MEPTPTQPYGGYPSSSSNDAILRTDNSISSDPTFSTTAAHATGDSPYPTDTPTQPTDSGLKGKLTDAVASGKQWLAGSGIADKAQQLPQQAKELGTKAWTGISGLTSTQKAVGVGIIAAGVAFLAVRSKHKNSDEGEYRHRPRRSPFDHQPHTKDGDYAYDRGRGQRPWGSSRYGTAAAPASGGKGRVSSGSGYTSAPSEGHSNDFGSQAGSYGGRRRDQGPAASGSRYDSRTSGGQNPNNLDDLSSAF